jgi:hypothetical protein
MVILVVKSHSGKCPQQILCGYFLGDAKRTGGLTQIITITVESAVAFFVEADMSIVKKSVKVADLCFGDGTLDDNISSKFSIGSFASDYAIKPQFKQPGINGGLAASSRNQEFMSACLGEAERFPGRLGKLLRVVDESAVNVEEDYLF